MSSAPKLDYAFLAEFAKVEPNGTLTSIGASYTRVAVSELPAAHQLVVAGRIRAPADSPEVPIKISYKASGEHPFQMEVEFVASGAGASPYGDGWVGVFFVTGTSVPLVGTGLNEVVIEVEGAVARRLYFEAMVVPPSS